LLIFFLKIEVWVVTPFKKPESDLPGNETFNNHVSIVRIRSEHAIGFLKGRFQSLKGLRINIRNEEGHKFATYWIVSCIGLHSFAMKCEREERAAADRGSDSDSFIEQGLSSSSSSSIPTELVHHRQRRAPRTSSLAAAKARRQQLKDLLLQAKARRAEQRRRDDRDSSEEDSN